MPICTHTLENEKVCILPSQEWVYISSSKFRILLANYQDVQHLLLERSMLSQFFSELWCWTTSFWFQWQVEKALRVPRVDQRTYSLESSLHLLSPDRSLSTMVLICLFKVLSFALTSENLYAMDTRVTFFSLWCPDFPRHDCHIKVVVSKGIPALKYTLQEPDLLCEHAVGAPTWDPTAHFLAWGESAVGAQPPVLQ